METTEHIRSLHAPLAEPSPDTDPSVGVGTTIAFDYLPIGPFLLIVALAMFAFIPAFAVIALVAVAGAVLALPFLLIRHFVGRR